MLMSGSFLSILNMGGWHLTIFFCLFSGFFLLEICLSDESLFLLVVGLFANDCSLYFFLGYFDTQFDHVCLYHCSVSFCLSIQPCC